MLHASVATISHRILKYAHTVEQSVGDFVIYPTLVCMYVASKLLQIASEGLIPLEIDSLPAESVGGDGGWVSVLG